MERRGLVVLVFSAVFVAVHSQTATTAVTTTKGSLTGIKFAAGAVTSVAYDGYIGIPYGDKPTRFKPAVARTAWTTTLALTATDGPSCPQPGDTSPNEDCLVLNVFTPTDAATNKATKTYPVIVFIHGGASGSSKIYGPDFLVSQSVIVVTMNYRLGALGFLTLGSKDAPGNLGLRDTLLALNWVKTEIGNFGGDPTKVTLMGHSFGSIMTQFHYLSAQSKGLFARVIAHSGSAMAPWGITSMDEGTKRGMALATALGCDTTQSSAVILTCLQGKAISDILAKQSISLPTETVLSGSGLPFVPVLDSSATADTPFFGDTLANLMVQAATNKVPMLTGFTYDEGIMKFSDDNWMQVENNLGAFVPQTASGDKKSSLSNDIRNQYFTVTPYDSKLSNLVKLYTDYMFAYPSVQVSRYFDTFTYGYLFSYRGSWAPRPPWGFEQHRQVGINNGDDLSYLFYSSSRTDQSLDTCTLNADNIKMKDAMVKWWTTFATTGAPDATSTWKTVNANGYLVINTTTSTMTVADFETRYRTFWSNLDTNSKSSASTLFSFGFLCLSLYTLIVVRL